MDRETDVERGAQIGMKRLSAQFILVMAMALSVVTSGLIRAEPGVAVDESGCRILSELPPPGVHPRIFFTQEDMPALKKRVLESNIGRIMQAHHDDQFKRYRMDQVREIGSLDLSNPTAEQVKKYFRKDEGRNIIWASFSVLAYARDDAELKQAMIKCVVNYSKLILAHKEMNPAHYGSGWSMLSSWTFHSLGMAITYDLLYHDMTKEQQDIIRKGIAAVTAGRHFKQMDWPKGRAVTNQYGYQGDLYVMMAAIEGEEGHDPEAMRKMAEVLINYWEVGFTPAGACHEDLYGPNLGMRAGGRGLMALARRGYNAYASEQFKNYVRYFAWELMPYRNGLFVGGASEGPGLPYPTLMAITKYMRPRDPVADYIWRYYVGEDYRRSLRWQSFLDYMLFGDDWDPERELTLEDTDLGLSTFFPRRGKFIARSDWSEDALYLQFDARPDAFQIGHDTVDRGHFNLCALGRDWSMRGSWHHWRTSQDHNLVHIDGKGQAWKAPMVKFLSHSDDGTAAIGAADLKYAYDWQWSPPWPKEEDTFPEPWEKETNDPRDLGWPDHPDWLPNTLHSGDMGYIGSYLWRQPYNPVQKAFRSTVLVRGTSPYAVIADDVRKDDEEHEYSWYMQVPLDLEIVSRDNTDIILGEGEKGDRRMLVRVLRADGSLPPSVMLERYPVKATIMAKRLIISCRSVEPAFRIMLYPHREGDPLPVTTWNKDKSAVAVTMSGGQKDDITFTPHADGRERISLTRISAGSGDAPGAGTGLTGEYYSNVALGKSATQSNTHGDAVAALAVDGNTDGNSSNGSMSHTGNHRQAWWEVDLESVYCIDGIRIWNRVAGGRDRWVMGRLSNYDVTILDSERNKVWSSHQKAYPDPVVELPVDQVHGRYVRIQLRIDYKSWLSLAEVEVFGSGADTKRIRKQP